MRIEIILNEIGDYEMSESLQHVLSRVRPPRVQITYDVEIGDAIEKKELPFVVGIVADLSGYNSENKSTLGDLSSRKFVEIDGGNFDDVMKACRPALKIKPANWLSDHQLGIIKRIKKLATLAMSVNADAKEIFLLSGCDALLKDKVIPTFAEEDKLKTGLRLLTQAVVEKGELDKSARKFLKSLIKLMAAYMPLKKAGILVDGFDAKVKATLDTIVTLVGADKTSGEYAKALADMEPEVVSSKEFNLEFNCLNDFSPLSVLKQSE